MNVRLDVEQNAEQEIVPCQNQIGNKIIATNKESPFLLLHPPQIVLKQECQAGMQEIYAEPKVVKTTQEMVPAWVVNQGQHPASQKNLCQTQRLVTIRRIKKHKNPKFLSNCVTLHEWLK